MLTKHELINYIIPAADPGGLLKLRAVCKDAYTAVPNITRLFLQNLHPDYLEWNPHKLTSEQYIPLLKEIFMLFWIAEQSYVVNIVQDIYYSGFTEPVRSVARSHVVTTTINPMSAYKYIPRGCYYGFTHGRCGSSLQANLPWYNMCMAHVNYHPFEIDVQYVRLIPLDKCNE